MKVELDYELSVFGKKYINSKDEKLHMTDVRLELVKGESYSYGELLDLAIQESNLSDHIDPNTIESVTLSRIIYEQ